MLENMCCGWHSIAQGTVLWQVCSAGVKPASTIQVSLAVSKTIPENSLKFRTGALYLKILQSLQPVLGAGCFVESYNCKLLITIKL